jgi:hypothetical protein
MAVPCSMPKAQTAVSISKVAVAVKGPLDQYATVDRVRGFGAVAAGRFQPLQHVGAELER